MDDQMLDMLARAGLWVLEKLNPASLPLVLACIPLTKKGTDLLVKLVQRFKNFTPSGLATLGLAALVAFVMTGTQAAIVGQFRDGTSLHEIAVLAIVAVVVWASSVATHETGAQTKQRLEQAKADRAAENGG